MSQYKVVVSKSAAKELSKLSSVANNRIIKAVIKLSDNPRPHGQRSSKEVQKIGELE